MKICFGIKKTVKNRCCWIQDCSAATENILLRVTDLGLGAVWLWSRGQFEVDN